MVKKMVKRFLKGLEADELVDLAKFFMDVAKGALGVPLVIYLVSGFSPVVIALFFVVDLSLVIIFLIIAIKLSREAKRRRKNG